MADPIPPVPMIAVVMTEASSSVVPLQLAQRGQDLTGDRHSPGLLAGRTLTANSASG